MQNSCWMHRLVDIGGTQNIHQGRNLPHPSTAKHEWYCRHGTVVYDSTTCTDTLEREKNGRMFSKVIFGTLSFIQASAPGSHVMFYHEKKYSP